MSKSNLSPEAQALLDAGRDALSPTTATKESVLQAIDASLATGTAAVGSGVLATGKLWLALTLVAGVGGGWILFRQDSDASEATKIPATVVAVAEVVPAPMPDDTPLEAEVVEAEVVEAEVVEAEVVEPVVALAPTEPPASENPSVQPRKPKAPRTKAPQVVRSSADDLLAERKLIASAQRAIRDKNYSDAKALLAEHQQSYPKGVLGPERQAAEAMVNCLEPNGTNGKAIARRFLERHASSPLAPRVRAICDLEK